MFYGFHLTCSIDFEDVNKLRTIPTTVAHYYNMQDTLNNVLSTGITAVSVLTDSCVQCSRLNCSCVTNTNPSYTNELGWLTQQLSYFCLSGKFLHAGDLLNIVKETIEKATLQLVTGINMIMAK